MIIHEISWICKIDQLKLLSSPCQKIPSLQFTPILPLLFVDTATFYTVSLLPLQIFGIFSAWLTGINHFIRKQIVSRSKGDLLAFFILLYICELVAITGHGLIILASKSFFCLYLHYQSFYTFLYRCKHPIFAKVSTLKFKVHGEVIRTVLCTVFWRRIKWTVGYPG